VTDSDASPRHALILAAGLGTRLQPLTYARAKPAIPVAGEPMICRIVRWLASHRVTEVVVNLHSMPETISGIVGDGSHLGVRVRYSWEQPHILGSAGGVRQALPILGAETFFIVNGDTLSGVDLGALASAHRRSGARVTLAVTPHPDPRRYGGMRIDGQSRATGFVRRGSGEASMHVVGVQIAHAEAFASIPAGAVVNSVGGLYDELIQKDFGSVAAHVTDAAFWDVGTPADYWQTSIAFARAENRPGTMVGHNVRVSPDARVSGSILWDDVEVTAGTVLDECIVADGVHVPEGVYRRQILVRPRHADDLIVESMNLANA
jgi:NDP-sugar pyrophosphorylase family protein